MNIKEDCEDTIKRCGDWIFDNKKNIKRMKKYVHYAKKHYDEVFLIVRRKIK